MSTTTYACRTWNELLEGVLEAVASFEDGYLSPSAVPFFRGHGRTSFKLVPTLLRQSDSGHWHTSADESNLYYEFRARAGALLPPGASSWDILFLMQHHGVPTRLLDWTENLGAALYFALTAAQDEIDIWMLDPYALNEVTFWKGHATTTIVEVDVDIPHQYADYFLEERQPVPWDGAVAIYPRRQHARLASQSGAFTLHKDITALEDTGLPGLTRFTLAREGLSDARQLLKLLGWNDFSLFPDLDGLSRLLKRRFPPQNEWFDS